VNLKMTSTFGHSDLEIVIIEEVRAIYHKERERNKNEQKKIRKILSRLSNP